MRIAVCGKGGVGKTTFSGILCRVLGRKGIQVLAIDGDPNPNLSIVLGMGTDGEKARPITADLMDKVEEMGGRKYIKLNTSFANVVEEFGLDAPDNVTLLMVGQPDHAGTGCMCSSHATVREVIHTALEDNGYTTVLDTEASLENMKRGTAMYVDVLFIVMEPYFRSLEAGGRFFRLAKELGINKIAVVANKVKTPDEEAAILQYCEKIGLPVDVIIPYDETISEADNSGISVMDYTDSSKAVDSITRLVEKLINE
ncbi:MAG: ArsA-related P-loop ATPase [Saprospiraceae bacterium]